MDLGRPVVEHHDIANSINILASPRKVNHESQWTYFVPLIPTTKADVMPPSNPQQDILLRSDAMDTAVPIHWCRHVPTILGRLGATSSDDGSRVASWTMMVFLFVSFSLASPSRKRTRHDSRTSSNLFPPCFLPIHLFTTRHVDFTSRWDDDTLPVDSSVDLNLDIMDKQQKDGPDGDGRANLTCAENLEPKAPPIKVFNAHILFMGLLVSLGGFIFGYEGGAISGYIQMRDFVRRFGYATTDIAGRHELGKIRTGCMVSFLCVGCLVGALVSAPVADRFGRKYSITLWNVVYIVGNIVAISARTTWYQVPIGRLVGGLGIGALSVLTPMYQSETSPKQVRGMLVSAYQLFITLGIFTSYCINYGTEGIDGPAAWRITMGCGFIAPTIMGLGALFLRESPRWDFRRGNHDAAATTLARVSRAHVKHPDVQHQLREIRHQLEAESAAGQTKWHEFITGPAMTRRTLLGITLQALQQLTGANFFFYYGTQIFYAVGIDNSYITSMILGAVNFGSTFVGLWVGHRYRRRPALVIGGAWMCICLLVFASLGSFALYPDGNPSNPNARTNPGVGYAMIAFACLFIFGFATTVCLHPQWGPLVWAIVGEMYPSRYRARCMGLATASNWLWNFLISFFTPFITGAINYRYGYVFAACCGAGAVIVYFFVIESQRRSLEEVDTMYVCRVLPWKSAKWEADSIDERDLGEPDQRPLHNVLLQLVWFHGLEEGLVGCPPVAQVRHRWCGGGPKPKGEMKDATGSH
ncbi:hypothetical protein ACRALDRAFT_211327 [Sodiomyces alcalophilus JCM 7366]|uniref:uncharacterized protein n=1 Tax=Sodiomyces alcalophilus JCM 7366 TaxID=591952 RepID=UPI0039B54754